jgi:basic amino acid/polyamine antiporter, APA family
MSAKQLREVHMPINGLKRVLGLPETAFIAIGTTIGGGIFVFTGIVLKMTGPAITLAYALAVLPVFITMLPLAMLGSALPVTGGNYHYPSRMVSPGLTFTGIWVYVLASFFGQIPLYSIACGRYMRVFFPELDVTLFAVGLVSFFFIINVLGVKPAAQVQGVMVLVLIAALAYYAVRGTAVLRPENFHGFFSCGTGNFLLGVALLTFTYLGSNAIIELGDEIKDPGRTIPRAFFINFPVVALLYLGVAFATVGAVQWQSLSGTDEPLLEAARSFMGNGGVYFFVAGGAVLALTTTLNGLFIIATKSILVVVQDGVLPAWLGTVNRRFGTAHVLFFIIWIISIAGILTGFSLETFASYSALGGMIIFCPVLIAAMRLPKLFPERYAAAAFRLKGAWLWICPVTGLVMVLFFGTVILADMKSPVRIGFFLLFILSGAVYYLLRKRYLSARGVNLEEIMHKEDWL